MNFFKKVKDFVLKPFQKKKAASSRSDGSKPIRSELISPVVNTPRPPEPKPLTPGDVLSSKGLDLIRNIGKGAFGEVWITHDKKADNYLALKIIQRSDKDPAGYEKEREAVERYRAHDLNNCSYFKVGAPIQLDSLSAFAYTMPLADDANGSFSSSGGNANAYEAKSLSLKLRRSGALSTEDCIEIAQNVIEDMEQLHRKRLIHRDIKPANILFFNGRAVLADIGLVTLPSPECSQRGTPGFVPHEGVGKARADIFAVGKLMFEMATGLPPDHDLRLPPHESTPAMRRLFQVITMACENDESKRYINSQALRMALKHVSEKEPHIPDEESTLNWIKLAEKERITRHMSDPRSLLKYKTFAQHLIKESTDRLKTDLAVKHLEPVHCFAVTEEVLHEFERRLGFQPVQALAVCNLTHAIVAGKQDSLKNIVLNKLGALEYVKHRRENTALTMLNRGIVLVIDKLWDDHYAQFEAP